MTVPDWQKKMFADPDGNQRGWTPADREWPQGPVWILPYEPKETGDYIASHKQHSLYSSLTAKEITAKLGVKSSGPSGDGKCKHQWDFVAVHPADPDATENECAIWDFKGARWSAFGPRWVFQILGFLPESP